VRIRHPAGVGCERTFAVIPTFESSCRLPVCKKKSSEILSRRARLYSSTRLPFRCSAPRFVEVRRGAGLCRTVRKLADSRRRSRTSAALEERHFEAGGVIDRCRSRRRNDYSFPSPVSSQSTDLPNSRLIASSTDEPGSLSPCSSAER